MTPYRYALDYLAALLRGEAQYVEQKALASTAILEARKHGLIDTRRSWHWRGHVPIDITILAA